MRVAVHALFASLGLLLGCEASDQTPTSPTDSSATSSADGALNQWTFTIQDTGRRPIGLLTVRLTSDKAESCLGGEWKKANVVSFTSTGEPAFPGEAPLAYELIGSNLVVGSVTVCDRYTMLGGEIEGNTLDGQYYSFGWGRRDLGFVTGKRDK